MSRYEGYNNIEDFWIQEVPSHWDSLKVGNVFNERKEKVSDKEFEPLSVTKNGILRQLENVAKTNDGDNRKKVLINDFVINSRSDRKGSSGLSFFNGSVSLINIVLTLKLGNSKYMHYLLRSTLFQEEFYRNGKGIVADLWSTNYQLMKNIIIPFPPIQEQKQIADYLDWKINEIDKLISIEKEKIKKLNGLFQSKLDSYFDIGNSNKSNDGIKIKNVVEQITLRSKDLQPYIALENIVSHKGELNKQVTDLVKNEDGIAVEPGMIVFGKLRPYLAKCILVDFYANCSSEFLVVKPIGINTKYLKYLMLSNTFVDLVNSSTYGTKMPRANSEYILNLRIKLKSIEEQIKDVEGIEYMERIINKNVGIINVRIDELSKLKESLISEVVTGQIDVRNVVIPAYEKVDSVVDEEIVGEELLEDGD